MNKNTMKKIITNLKVMKQKTMRLKVMKKKLCYDCVPILDNKKVHILLTQKLLLKSYINTPL